MTFKGFYVAGNLLTYKNNSHPLGNIFYVQGAVLRGLHCELIKLSWKSYALWTVFIDILQLRKLEIK